MAPSARKLRLAVLVSGGGTNLQAMIDRSLVGSLDAEISVVLSDRPEAFGLARAKKAGIPAYCVDYKKFVGRGAEDCARAVLPVNIDALDRRQNILKNPVDHERKLRLTSLVLAEQELIRIIDPHRPDYICLAGFMRLVTPYFINYFNKDSRKILNIHPALLPSFPGRHGYEDTYEYGCKWGGITVHFVDEGEDTGSIIAQAVYPIWPHDNPEKIRERGLMLEYDVYAQVVNWLARGQVEIQTSPEGRDRVEITDPGYGEVVRGWISRVL